MNQVIRVIQARQFPKSFFLLFLILVSGISWFYSYRLGLSTSYNDAMAHLNLSRSVIDNITPGLSQLGGVWLPFNHLLTLTLVWNDWAFHSGFAGSFFSMLSFVLSAVALMEMIYLLTNHRLASITGALVYALNPNMLYLQTTPLTEPLYLLFFILSCLFFLKWVLTQNEKYLLLIGVFGMLQVVTRYDGWFVVAFEAVILISIDLWVHRHSITDSLGKLLIFLFPVGFGIFSWLLWNLVIFKDPLFFALGPYSARAQQTHIQHAGGLITKHNLFMATVAYADVVKDNIGLAILIISGIGLLLFFLRKQIISNKTKLLVFLFLSAPILFNILALFLGFSIVNVPELHWNPSHDPGARWFNVRYGILALPLIAVFCGVFAGTRKLLPSVLLLELILLQIVFMYPKNIITITDGTAGSSSYANSDVSTRLTHLVKPTSRLLLAESYFSPVAFKSNLPLRHVITEGVSTIWQNALVHPEQYADFIVMANGNIGEPVYTSLFMTYHGRFLRYYTLAYKGKHANIYERIHSK